jgi:hypothetical protein
MYNIFLFIHCVDFDLRYCWEVCHSLFLALFTLIHTYRLVIKKLVIILTVIYISPEYFDYCARHKEGDEKLRSGEDYFLHSVDSLQICTKANFLCKGKIVPVPN